MFPTARIEPDLFRLEEDLRAVRRVSTRLRGTSTSSFRQAVRLRIRLPSPPSLRVSFSRERNVSGHLLRPWLNFASVAPAGFGRTPTKPCSATLRYA